VGYSSEAFGADRNAVMLSLGAARHRVGAQQQLFLGGDFSRIEDGRARN
jgi:hypothetical protein